MRKITAMRPPLITSLICILLLGVCLVSPPAVAGKNAYPEFMDTVAFEAVEVLKKNGMNIAHDRENPWLGITGIPGNYTLHLYRAKEIPQQAVMDIIELCMNLYERRERKEAFRIVMYFESREQWRDSLFLGIGALAGIKPYFELTIGEKE